MQDTTNPLIAISDLGLAAALFVGLQPPVRIEMVSPKKAAFIFPQSPQTTQIINQYWEGTLTINASAYFDAIKKLKTRLYTHIEP